MVSCNIQMGAVDVASNDTLPGFITWCHPGTNLSVSYILVILVCVTRKIGLQQSSEQVVSGQLVIEQTYKLASEDCLFVNVSKFLELCFGVPLLPRILKVMIF